MIKGNQIKAELNRAQVGVKGIKTKHSEETDKNQTHESLQTREGKEKRAKQKETNLAQQQQDEQWSYANSNLLFLHPLRSPVTEETV